MAKEERKKKAERTSMSLAPVAEDESCLLACYSTPGGSRRCTKTPVVDSGLQVAGAAALALSPITEQPYGDGGSPNISKLHDITC